MSNAEKQLLEAVDPQVDIEEAARNLAPVLKRTPAALKKAISDVRAGLIERAERTSDILMESMESALAGGQPQVSGRLALDVLDRLSIDGERVFEPPQQIPAGSGVQIFLGIKLGGTKDSQSPSLQTLTVDQPLVDGEAPLTVSANGPHRKTV